MEELIAQIWPHLLALGHLLAALGASAHAVLHKRESRAAVLWVGLIWLVPMLGPLMYLTFGINRIRRRARALRQIERAQLRSASAFACGETALAEDPSLDRLAPLRRLVDRVTHHPLLRGNRVDLLLNGDQAFPAMLEAIGRARHSVSLCSYIFDQDHAGRRFVDALAAATRRGVEVRVLIDAVGARYSWPRTPSILRRAGVPVRRFLRTTLPWRFPYMNLRNHRKILVVDGRVGFVGGMNIREGNLLARKPTHPIIDVHARVEGPVVGHLQQAFAEDWRFSKGEELRGEAWFPELEPSGSVLARGVPDGPDEDFEEIRMTLLGALAAAQQRVRILTPYFLPDAGLVTALNVAALRGIQVDIVLPAKGNLALVQWASIATVGPLLDRGCHIYLTPPPFDHSKVMVVDGAWSLLGSANWDPRSLRLNFEYCIECYSRTLASEVEQIVEERIARAAELSFDLLRTRPLALRLRDGMARLLSPFL